jgi:hypothetical protein
VAAERYRAARRGKLALAGAGDWEEVLRVLEDGDIRGYQDVDKLRTRVGRPGTLEDGQLAAVVFESPVRSGLLAPSALDRNRNRSSQFQKLQKPDRTATDRSFAVFCGYKTGFDRLLVLTGS